MRLAVVCPSFHVSVPGYPSCSLCLSLSACVCGCDGLRVSLLSVCPSLSVSRGCGGGGGPRFEAAFPFPGGAGVRRTGGHSAVFRRAPASRPRRFRGGRHTYGHGGPRAAEAATCRDGPPARRTPPCIAAAVWRLSNPTPPQPTRRGERLTSKGGSQRFPGVSRGSRHGDAHS